MRTRLQEALFFKQYSEERKKKKAAAVNGGDQSKNGDSGARAAVDGGDSSSPVSSEQLKSNCVNVGFKEGLGSVIPKEGENLGVKSDGKLREGLEENQGVLIGGERDEIQEVLRKEENVGRVDLKENSESSKRVLEEKNKSVDGVVCGADESDDSDDGEVVFLGMERRKEGLRKEENVGRVDLKENCESSRSVEEKNKSLDGVVRGADESDDSDGGVVFLGMEHRKESEVGLRKKQKSSGNLKKNKNVVETGSGGDDDDVVFLGIDYSRVEIGVDGVAQNGVMGSNCNIDLQGTKEVRESRDAMKSGARGSAELVSDSGYSEESEWSSDEDSEGCSDQDNVGSTDVDSDGSPSCSDYEDEIDEDERSICNGKGKEKMTEIGSVDRRGKGEMIKVGLKSREKSPDFVYLGRARRDGGIIEGDGDEEMIKVGLKRREKSPDFVYLGRARRDGGIIEGDGDEEMIKVGLKRRREKSPDFVYLGRAHRDGGIIEGDGDEGMIKVGLKRRREKLPDFVYLGRAHRDGGIVEGDGEEEMIKVGLKRREKSPDFVYLGRAHRDGERKELKGNDVRKVGLKRRREKSPDFVYLGRARRDGEGEKLKGNDVREEGIVEGDGEQETIEKSGRGRSVGKLNCSRVDEEKDGSDGLKRMTYSGLDLLVGRDREKAGKDDDPEGPKSVAERIHLRPRRGNKKELGSFSCPLTLSDKELESSSGDDDGTDNDEDERSDRSANDSKKVGKSGEKSKGKVGRPPAKGSRDRENGNDANNVWRSHEISKGKVGRPAKRRHGCAGSAAPIRIEKILADSVWQNSDVPEECSVSFQVPDLEVTLPLKFRFLDEDPIPPEKSSWEIEADKLFAEMDFALAACEIGASDSSMVDSEDSVTEETESDPATSCREGKHQLVLDDEIGLKCKFCSFVKLEIKHILPSFSKHPWGRREKNYWNSSDHCNFENIQFQDSASTSNSKDQICAEGTVWDIIPGIKTSMYPHQREGFEFIWKNIGGSIDLEDLKKHTCDGGSGCIISHAPGTGKTRLAIVFLQTFMELNPKCMPVIVAPRSMLLTWEEEFKKWKVDIPFHNLNQPEFSGREDTVAFNLLKKVGRQGPSLNTIRLVKLFSWKMGKSILGISYRLFEKLAEDGIVSADENGAGKRKRKAKRYAEAEQVRKMLLELPGLLVLDEGHTPRNDQSLMWRALSGVQTQRRILLSGTPFQNNFHELFNTLCLVRPKFSDRIGTEIKGDCRKKRGREGRKGRGKWASLTNSIGKDAGDKLDKLRAIIDPFVHVHKGMILEENLPGLRDALVVLNPTDLQKSLIEVFQGRNVLKRDHLASLISVHPSLLLGCALSEEEGLSVNTNELETLRFDPRAGAKTHFLMELIRLSMAVKEKVLVFSQFLEPLAFIREQLKSIFGWTEGKDLLYMDGQIEAKHRQSSISLLNDPESQVQVLLASTRACCEGISLVGASRVVLLDVVWNPAVERQAISRAYRIGQKKVVYIYRLIMSGTMEGEKCVRQAEKDRLSELVFSSAEGKDHGAEIISRAVNDDKILQEMVQHEKISYMFSKILNQPKVSNLVDIFG